MNDEGRTYREGKQISTDGEATSYKVMFWSGLDTLVPLCTPLEGNIVK